jgi:hypothetical protein
MLSIQAGKAGIARRLTLPEPGNLGFKNGSQRGAWELKECQRRDARRFPALISQ